MSRDARQPRGTALGAARALSTSCAGCLTRRPPNRPAHGHIPLPGARRPRLVALAAAGSSLSSRGRGAAHRPRRGRRPVVPHRLAAGRGRAPGDLHRPGAARGGPRSRPPGRGGGRSRLLAWARRWPCSSVRSSLSRSCGSRAAVVAARRAPASAGPSRRLARPDAPSAARPSPAGVACHAHLRRGRRCRPDLARADPGCTPRQEGIRDEQPNGRFGLLIAWPAV